jgi:hypothetical protein
MPKTLPGAIATEVSKVKASEPLIIIEVQWNASTKRFYAAENYGLATDQLLQVSALSTIVRIGDAGSAASASAVISDTDGLIKGLLGTTDVHKVPVNIYLAYATLTFADKYLVFAGELNTPAVWDDAERTFSFDIVSKIENGLVGFSPEQAEDDLISEDAVGVAWPLCFGSPLHVPAVRLNEQPIGTALFYMSVISGGTTAQICNLAKQRRQYERLQENADDDVANTTMSEPAYWTVLDNLGSASTALVQAVLSATQAGASSMVIDNLIVACEKLQDAETDLAFWSGQSVSAQSLIDTTQAAIDALNDQIAVVTVQLAEATAANPQDPARIASLNASLVSLNATLVTAGINLGNAQAEQGEAQLNIGVEQGKVESFTKEAQNAEDALIRIQIPPIVIKGGDKFPQGVPLTIMVNNMKFTGEFAGELFSATEATAMDPNDIIPDAFIDAVPGGGVSSSVGQFTYTGPIQIQGQYGWTGRYLFYVNSQYDNLVTYTPAMFRKTGVQIPVIGASPRDVYVHNQLSGAQVFSPFIRPEWLAKLRSNDADGTLPAFASGLSHISYSDFTINIGDQVRLVNSLPEVYVANLIPSTEIKEVMAYRTIDGVRRLVPVPSGYYTIDLGTTEILGQFPTTVTLKQPLSSRLQENWEDRLYVSLTSSEGPNTADALEYLFDNYSDLTPDAASFATLSGFLAEYPSHFCILDRPNVLDVAERIAWQARSAIFVRGSTVFVKYLAYETAEVLTLDNDNTEFGALQMELSTTEDIVTVFKAKWKTEYTEEKEKEVVLRNNIPKYGTIEEEYDFFIYNIESLVVKSATFWMIRYSNTWKRAKLTSMFDTFELDEFDSVLLAYGEGIFGSGSIKGIVEAVEFDPDTMSLVYDIWTSVRCGELTEYPFAWPANANPVLEYPTAADLFSGGAAT